MKELTHPETQISYNFLIKFWHGIKYIHSLLFYNVPSNCMLLL